MSEPIPVEKLPELKGRVLSELEGLTPEEASPTKRVVQKVRYDISTGARYNVAFVQELSQVVQVTFPEHANDNGPDRIVLSETPVGTEFKGERGSMSDYRLKKAANKLAARQSFQRFAASQAKANGSEAVLVPLVKTTTKKETATAVKKG
jgi:hypothetical protein